jgi:hypothetical protein
MSHEWFLLQYAKQREKEIFIAVRGEYYLNHSRATGKRQPKLYHRFFVKLGKLLVSLGCALQSRNGSERMNCRNQMT